MKTYKEIITEKKVNIKYDGVPSKFFVVTKPLGKTNQIIDIMFETSLEGMALQFLGGLKPSEILFVTDNKQKAEKFANKILK